MSVTTRSMRDFAADCLKWAMAYSNPSHCQLIVDAARTWARTADHIDRRLARGAEFTADLRSKLN